MVDDTLYPLLVSNNELLTHIYALLLFCVGAGASVLVIYLLYRFIKMFY